MDGDGCSATCTVETGWSCTEVNLLSVCSDICGDGVNNFPEEGRCDDNNFEDGDGCSRTCQIEEGWRCVDNAQKLSECFEVSGRTHFNPRASLCCCKLIDAVWPPKFLYHA